MMSKCLILATLAFSIFTSISCKEQKVESKADLAKTIEATDLEFSNVSKAKGYKAAFMQFMDSNAVLLRPNHYPIVGSELRTLLQERDDTSFTLIWEPKFANIAASADLGYTYGIYTLTSNDTTMQGTYATVWKKQKDGSWKWILDTGNQGLKANKRD